MKLLPIAALATALALIAAPAMACDCDYTWLEPGESTTTQVWFDAGQWASVTVEGDGTADMDISVAAPNGREVASGYSGYDYEHVEFTARRAGWYTVTIYNNGVCGSEYWLDTSAY